MSVVVQQLTKIYGQQRVLDEISFSASKGKILGFLGPNGAGKTSTMKIITGFLAANAGSVEVCGEMVTPDNCRIKQKIGYLPEHNPLYKDMYVKEYLSFVANIHKIDKPKARIAELIEKTGLTLEQNKIIGALSKGYRQRVGLAQALLHDPEVVILDEPSSGLDPNQLIEIRQFIKELGKQKTVILSTHIMQEVQALCDEVVIINRGKIVANQAMSAFKMQNASEMLVTVEWEQKPQTSLDFKEIQGLKSWEQTGEKTIVFTSAAADDIRPALFKFAVAKGLTIIEMRRESQTIEQIFQQITH